jgi:diguanylate cyclase (GGDEF)-like protein
MDTTTDLLMPRHGIDVEDMPHDPVQPMRVAQSLLAIAVYAVFAALHEVEAAMGLVAQGPARLLSAVTLGAALAFYLLVRTGASVRLFGAGNGVVMMQCLFGVAAAAWAYAINGALRGGCLLIFVLVLVFGMFALRPLQSRVVGAAGLGMLAAAAFSMSNADPLLRPWPVECMHILFATVSVAILQVLSERLAGLRATVLDQKLQLEDSLERLKELATRDELTGLVNRRQMMLRIEAEFARLERSHEELAVALIDLDHFKRINDSHGHHVGDMVLQSFARLAGNELRGSDLLARWGGEEFLLLLPMTPHAVACSAVERLRDTLTHRPAGASPVVRAVTFSAGVAMHEPGDTVHSLIERADRAMYQAKRLGRDRTVMAERRPARGRVRSAHAFADGP